MTVIGENAFYHCQKVKDIYCKANPDTLEWSDSSYGFLDGKATLCHVPDNYLATYQSKFGSMNLTFVGEHVDMTLGELLYGYSVCLDGDIGVKFYMRFNDYASLSSGAKMVFTISSIDGSDTRTQTVYVKPQSNSSLACADYDNGYYVFKCTLKAKEMTSLIKAQIVDGSTKGTEYTYSVQEYADYMLSHSATYAQAQDLVKAMLNYGASAQKYFNYNTSNYANSILPSSEQNLPTIDYTTLVFDASDLDAGNVHLARVSLSVKSTISLNLYYENVPGGAVFKSGNKVLPTRKSGDYTVVTVNNIWAQDINKAVTVNVYGSNNSLIGETKFAPMKYCEIVLRNGSTMSSELKALVSDMCRFSLASADYRANNVG